MTFPSFAVGEVLRAQDMNAVGLWKVAEATFTNQTAVQIDGCFDEAIYTSYYISFRLTASAASDVFYRFVSGTTPIIINYVYNRHYGYSSAGGGTGYTYGDLAAYSYFTTCLAWGSGGSANVRLPLSGSSATVALNAQSTTGNNGTPYGMRNDVGSGCITTSAINGIYLSTFSATTFSGNIEIYGAKT
jgi:hypothetical protein